MRKISLYSFISAICAACVYVFIGAHSIQKTESIVAPPKAINAPKSDLSNESNFDIALKAVYLHEGFISDDKEDKGGYTKWGISLAFLKAEHLDIDGDGDVDVADVKALSKSKTRDLYYDLFWKRHNYDDIKDLKVSTKIFDMAVNVGGSRANKIVKMAINLVTDEDIYVTGILDPDTIDIINEIEPVVLLDAIRKEQADFYIKLVKIHPEYKKFQKGWLNRAKW